MDLLNTLLQYKPLLLKRASQIGLDAVTQNVKLLNIVTEKILLINELDPNSVPGNKFKNDIENSLTAVHTESYDDSFDTSKFPIKAPEKPLTVAVKYKYKSSEDSPTSLKEKLIAARELVKGIYLSNELLDLKEEVEKMILGDSSYNSVLKGYILNGRAKVKGIFKRVK